MTIDIVWISLVLFFTQLINHKLRFQKKMEQKQEKEVIAPKNFDSIYKAVNARLKTSNNKHLFYSILISPKQSGHKKIY